MRTYRHCTCLAVGQGLQVPPARAETNETRTRCGCSPP